MNKNNQDKCLLCDKLASVRGLCRSHYETYRTNKALAKDKDSFEREAVARNMIAAEDKRKASNPFAALREELEDTSGKAIAAETSESYKKTTKKKPKP